MEGRRGCAFIDAGEFDGGFDGFLRVRFVQMKTPEFVRRGWQARQFNRRKEPLPHPFFGGARIFLLQRMGQKDADDLVSRPLLLMSRFELFDMREQFRDNGLRHRHGAVFLAFAVMHGDDAGVEIEAMNAEIQAFEQAQAAAVCKSVVMIVHLVRTSCLNITIILIFALLPALATQYLTLL